MEDAFPGLTATLIEEGAQIVDPTRDTRRVMPYGYVPRFVSGLELLLVSRERLEWTIRERLLEIPGVTIRAGVAAQGLAVSGSEPVIEGLRISENGEETVLGADLVVDATGRGSSAPRWLEAIGLEPPQERLVDAGWGYASRFYRKPEWWNAEWKAAGYLPLTYGALAGAGASDARLRYASTRGGVAVEQDGDRILVTLYGTAGEHPSTEPGEFEEFAASLVATEVGHVVQHCEPLSSIRRSRSTSNRQRCYHRLRQPLPGFLVVGDAFGALNPVYGQGMTMAAMSVACLDDVLRQGKHRGQRPEALTKEIQRRISKEMVVPWRLATGGDYGKDEVQGEPQSRVARAATPYARRVVALGADDPETFERIERTANLVMKPTWMVTPSVAYRVVRNWRRLGHRFSAEAFLNSIDAKARETTLPAPPPGVTPSLRPSPSPR